MKKIRYSWMMALALSLVAGYASAHVSVKPGEVGIGAFQTFNVSVPSERPIPTVGLRLVLPEGLEHVSPTVKPGWTIKLVKSEEAVKEIVWTGGKIPGEFRDDFTFSAKAPAAQATLLWKAYQTYSDGSVVSWELAPGQEQPKNADGSSDFSKYGPASQTKIIDDLSKTPAVPQASSTKKSYDDSLFVSMIAVVIAVAAVYLARRRHR